MIEVDRYYGKENTPEMCEHGHGPIPWPIRTELSSILSKLLDEDKVKTRSFHNKWLAEFYLKKDLNKDKH